MISGFTSFLTAFAKSSLAKFGDINMPLFLFVSRCPVLQLLYFIFAAGLEVPRLNLTVNLVPSAQDRESAEPLVAVSFHDSFVRMDIELDSFYLWNMKVCRRSHDLEMRVVWFDAVPKLMGCRCNCACWTVTQPWSQFPFKAVCLACILQ